VASAHGLRPEARTYALLRGIDVQGRGQLSLTDATAGLRAYFSTSRASELLTEVCAAASADGSIFVDKYWSAKHNSWMLHIRKPAEVLRRLGDGPARHWVHASVPKLLSRGYVREFHRVAAAARNGRPTSRETHTLRSGTSPATQRRAERDEAVAIERNARLYEKNDPATPRLDRPGVIRLNNGNVIEQLPNSSHIERKVVKRSTSAPVTDAGAGAKRRYVDDRDEKGTRRTWGATKRDIAGGREVLVRDARHSGWRFWRA
jgi:hypothetical protein